MELPVPTWVARQIFSRAIALRLVFRIVIAEGPLIDTEYQDQNHIHKAYP